MRSLSSDFWVTWSARPGYVREVMYSNGCTRVKPSKVLLTRE